MLFKTRLPTSAARNVRTATSRLGRELFDIVVPFLLTMAAVALALRLLNSVPAWWVTLMVEPTPVPMALNERLECPSIEAAETDLQVKVSIPRYFPSYLARPPASVRGQREPVKVVSLLFRSQDGQQALQIREIFWPGEDLPFPVPEPVEVLERRDLELDGAAWKLLIGRGQGNQPVNQVRWHADGVHFVVTAIYPPEELMMICQSLHP